MADSALDMLRFFLGALWLTAFTFAGYVLTDRSFSFLMEPGFGLAEDAPLRAILEFDPEALKERLPEPGESPEAWYASLTSEEQACLERAVSASTFQSALRGEEIRLTASETLAVSLCLK